MRLLHLSKLSDLSEMVHNYQTILSYVMDKVDEIIYKNKDEKSIFISREYWNSNLYHETL